MKLHVHPRVRNIVGVVLATAGVLGLIGLPNDLGAWAKLVSGLDSWLVYAAAYGVLVVLGVGALLSGRTDRREDNKPGSSSRVRADEPVAAPPEPVKASPVASQRIGVEASQLRRRLQRLLDEGVQLDRRIPANTLAAFSGIVLEPRPTETDVAHWEARVEHALQDHPRKLSLYRYDAPKNALTFASAISVSGLGNPLKKRIERRLVALEKVIKETR